MFRKYSKGPGVNARYNVTKATYGISYALVFQKLFHRKHFTIAPLQHVLCFHSSIFCFITLKPLCICVYSPPSYGFLGFHIRGTETTSLLDHKLLDLANSRDGKDSTLKSSLEFSLLPRIRCF